MTAPSAIPQATWSASRRCDDPQSAERRYAGYAGYAAHHALSPVMAGVRGREIRKADTLVMLATPAIDVWVATASVA